MTMAQIKVGTDVRALNNELADENKELFHASGVFVIDVLGSPGSGKTTLLENLIPLLSEKYTVAVIEGDLATRNDAERIERTGVAALQINTNGGCHLDARMIKELVPSLDLKKTDILIIENVGNLVCPVSFALGEDLRLTVLSTAEGEDKPLKYPTAMIKTDCVVLSKTDIAPYVGVDVDAMAANVAAVNAGVRIIKTGKENGAYDARAVADFVIDAYNNR